MDEEGERKKNWKGEEGSAVCRNHAVTLEIDQAMKWSHLQAIRSMV